VEGGGAVQRDGLENRVRRCHLIAFAIGNEGVVSTAAIKNPENGYVESISLKSGHKLPRGVRELGYVATQAGSRGRGLARKICRNLVESYGEELFATTTEEAMERILSALGFDAVSSPWESELHPERQLKLWIRTGPVV